LVVERSGKGFGCQFTGSRLPSVSVASLPVLVCQVFGGNPVNTVPVIVAWRFLCLSAKLFDDVEDGDGSSIISEQINTATSLLFLAQLAIGKLVSGGLDVGMIETLRKQFNHAGLMACAGQYLDLSSNHDRIFLNPDSWLDVASAKSGTLFAWAAQAGAMVAGAPEADHQLMWEYGLHLGVLKQVTDDIQDFWFEDRLIVSSTYQSSLPICYTAWVLQGQDRDDFIELLAKLGKKNLSARNLIREIVEDQGAIRFAKILAKMQYDQGLHALRMAAIPNESSSPLIKLLEVTMPCPPPFEDPKTG
jgi:geranylgeranyl pyrophosphate synthase